MSNAPTMRPHSDRISGTMPRVDAKHHAHTDRHTNKQTTYGSVDHHPSVVSREVAG